jgi:translation initiation factor 2 subunit 3
MSDDESRHKPLEDSDSDEELLDAAPNIEVNIDPSKLTPLSPEVISKQVSFVIADRNLLFLTLRHRLLSI